MATDIERGVPVTLDPLEKNVNVVEKVAEILQENALPFDPVKLKEKYDEERERRLKHGKGVEQYQMVDGKLLHYLEDPWVKPGFQRDPIDEEVEVVVIGGGYGAQLIAVRLLEAGVENIRLIEKAGDFGGTWYWNRYPGAQCDVESYIYMPILEEVGYMPTEKYARAKELLRHSRIIGEKFGLYPRTLFQTEVSTMHWDDTNTTWTTKTSRGDSIRSRFVIPAAGPLHRPKFPGAPGIESFKGHSFHSARWDYNYTGGDSDGGLSKLSDKRVGIIGTGATAVQIVPHLGEAAKDLYVFQRTPSSIDVRGNKPTDSAWAKTLKKGWQSHRMENFDMMVNGIMQEEDLVGDGWTDIIARLLVPRKTSEPIDPAQMAIDRQMADFEKMNQVRARCDAIVKDPVTAESLKPYYNQFCKRPCFHDEYLQTFNRPNVHLVDTHGDGIQAFTEKGIIANGEEIELDCIVIATGFELSTDWSHRSGMEIYGRDNISITEKWKKGASTLHGWASRGFPNCFWVSIVQAALTPNFMHVTAEQARHIAYVIAACRARNIRAIEPSEKAEQDWVQKILDATHLRADFLKECTPGYYNNEGKPSEFAARNGSYGGGAPAFIKILQEWRAADNLEGLETKKIET
ncbi:FAD/NAD(P)-binding domain-containing protein [Eremomyces bilateralis CBS 781.70]|uniref:FAD/NAD(P)-binding domain-containing protein n=1 Tax=Eremomyces bilateralis CBS 781.70 TaxID=1392243 RepID=A0A6G1FQI4_9PEZI|nr:FAD/NAD(P)-binding domain-containing protein [Eremomyces bilateralis CBS 781.70]KAF1807949.1 FAD/NAD(P)-binding domain-containing protein [Eremomyces bilateralis CBS 781.70]